MFSVTEANIEMFYSQAALNNSFHKRKCHFIECMILNIFFKSIINFFICKKKERNYWEYF